ncbi:MAG: hypothetical protein GVY35_14255, partial [Bacteroidetes bacterium]|nr:hypothetical protein [Bacteroidota bacterium]
LPPRPEQRAIADALSDVDALIERLDALIAKKRAIKTATMQRLLTGQQRLPGFGPNGSSYCTTGSSAIPEDWEVFRMEDIAECLDSERIPLNEKERSSMNGSIPYCGANGVLDYIDYYIFDEDIILLAEDGGHFYEYATRPIAYRMTGKCWVNNHAHVLRAKEHFSQDYLFYSLVHKDITEHLSSGTRAKLNRSELNKITVSAPPKRSEQQAIATILADMDAEIEVLQARRDKTQAIKQGMMQELLTGRTRLVWRARNLNNPSTIPRYDP